MNLVTNFLTAHGLTRDSKVWSYSQLLALAALVAANPDKIPVLGAWLGMTISPVLSHWIDAVAVALLWFAGKHDSSPLPGAPKP